MTAKAALIMAFLEGRVLNVGNCFKEIGLSNIAREVPRMIEEPFGVEISKMPRAGKNRYGSPVSYTDYRLNATQYNEKGILAMRKYIEDNGGIVAPLKRAVGRPKKETNSITPVEKLF